MLIFSPTPNILLLQGVSRRSLDRILDPDVSFSWMESMATPPTQSAGKNQTVIEENDVLSCIDKDDDLVLCDNLADSDMLLDDPSHVDEGHSPTASKLSKKVSIETQNTVTFLICPLLTKELSTRLHCCSKSSQKFLRVTDMLLNMFLVRFS